MLPPEPHVESLRQATSISSSMFSNLHAVASIWRTLLGGNRHLEFFDKVRAATDGVACHYHCEIT